MSISYVFARKLYQSLAGSKNREPLRSLKNKYNYWFWKERNCSFLKGKAEHYIIRRYAQNMGIGSYIISNLSQINYAKRNNWNPVIDMKNYNGITVNGKRVNAWELYYDQPYPELNGKLDGIYSQKKYRLSDGICRADAPNDSMDFFLNKKTLAYWSILYRENCRFNSAMQSYADKEYDSIIKGKRVVGVLCRGTDYLKLKPKGHPVQPDPDLVIVKVKRLMKDYNCGYVYLATEDEAIEKLFRVAFLDKLLVNKRVYKKYSGGYLANTLNNREDDVYHTNVEYLSSLYLLSRCNCFVAGRTSGAVITMLMDTEYEYTYFWDLGVYK